MNLEHGKLPDPFSEAIRLILKEQHSLEERIRKLEGLKGIEVAPGELESRITEIEKAFGNGEGI
jgi:hypothetical protein